MQLVQGGPPDQHGDVGAGGCGCGKGGTKPTAGERHCCCCGGGTSAPGTEGSAAICVSPPRPSRVVSTPHHVLVVVPAAVLIQKLTAPLGKLRGAHPRLRRGHKVDVQQAGGLFVGQQGECHPRGGVVAASAPTAAAVGRRTNRVRQPQRLQSDEHAQWSERRGVCGYRGGGRGVSRRGVSRQ